MVETAPPAVIPCEQTMPTVSVILPIVCETDSLSQTIETLERGAGRYVQEYIFVAAKHASPQTVAMAQELCAKLEARGVYHVQRERGVGAAIREAFSLAKAEYVVMMNSDLETDPEVVPQMIEKIVAGNLDVVTASRWLKPGSFYGYSPVKLVFNWLGQKFLAALYGVKLSDLTFGFRIFRRQLVQAVRWEETMHPFFLETLLKPLRLGACAGEIPCVWRARREGYSSNTFLRNLQYFTTGLRVRLQPLKSIVKEGLTFHEN